MISGDTDDQGQESHVLRILTMSVAQFVQMYYAGINV